MKHSRKKEILPQDRKRLEKIGLMLRELRFSEGKKQYDYVEYGISRRKIQRGEHSCNLSMISLFQLLDCYGYRLDEFFEGMD